MTATDREFEIQGVHHLALVCKDMARTVEFYRDVLGMPLVKTLDLPDGTSQHFFFDMGGGNSLAFFWFANAPEAAPGMDKNAKQDNKKADNNKAAKKPAKHKHR